MDEGREVILFILAPFETVASANVMRYQSNARFKENRLLYHVYNTLETNLRSMVSNGTPWDSIFLMDFSTTSLAQSRSIAKTFANQYELQGGEDDPVVSYDMYDTYDVFILYKRNLASSMKRVRDSVEADYDAKRWRARAQLESLTL